MKRHNVPPAFLFISVPICLMLTACNVRSDHGISLAPADIARSCHVDGVRLMSNDSAAVRCAESFIARNGYTLNVPADTSELALESIELQSSWRERLATRRNSLSPRAAVLCQGARNGAGYTIVFTKPGDTLMQLGRAVTMDTTFSAMEMEHKDFLLTQARGDRTCASWPSATLR